MALSAKAVRVFATVEVLRDNQADVRHALATLFEPDLARFNGEVFDPEKVAAQVNEQYRLGITAEIIAGFTEIFQSRGWLSKVLDGERSAYLVKCHADNAIPQELHRFKEQAASVAEEFREFISEISPLSQVKKSDEELVDDLVEWLMQLDRASENEIKIVAANYKVGRKIHIDINSPDDAYAPSEATFLSARFVDYLFKSKSPHIGFLVELGEVGLITEVVRDFQRPTTTVQRSDLIVYLDAPVAMDLLGLSGTAQRASIESILAGLTALGGSVRIFRQSIEEMQAALSAVLARPVTDRIGPTADALRRGEVLEAYVRQVAASPDRVIDSYKIGIVDQKLEAFPNEHRYFTQDVIDLLYSQISWVREDAARFHDASITGLVMRKRAGRNSADLFEAKHVVLTRNPTFPRLARRIAQEHSYIGPRHVGPVVHQRQLATAVWLRVGARADSDIPRRYILSACRRVLTLRKNIVEKVHQLKSNLSEQQASQLELLLAESRSTQVLMDKTMGSAALIDSTNIAVLLEEMKKAQIAEHTKAADAKLKAAQKEHQQRYAKLEGELAESKTLSDKSAAIVTDKEKQIDAVFDRAIASANRTVRKIKILYTLGFVAVFLLMSGASYFGNGDSIWWSVGWFIMSTGLGVLFLFSEKLRDKVFTPLLRKQNAKTLTKTFAAFGLDPNQAAPLTVQTPHGFERADTTK